MLNNKLRLMSLIILLMNNFQGDAGFLENYGKNQDFDRKRYIDF